MWAKSLLEIPLHINYSFTINRFTETLPVSSEDLAPEVNRVTDADIVFVTGAAHCTDGTHNYAASLAARDSCQV